MAGKLSGKVCLVTGASRGIGKGVAIQLAMNGAKVYITGRTVEPVEGASIEGSLRETTTEIETRGGICVPVQCDHKDDKDVEKLFERIKEENDGQLDILVNNAYSGLGFILSNVGVPYWEQPMSGWDEVHQVGLRNNYICAIYAARLMVPRKQGLIVNMSSGGGLLYLFCPLYGIGKEACDRMAHDCGEDLKKHNVAFVSLWPGYVKTETVGAHMPENNRESKLGEQDATGFNHGESMDFAGQCVVALAADRKLMKKSGKILLTSDLLREYRLKDKEGYGPTDIRKIKFLLNNDGHRRIARFVPGFIRLPKWLMATGGKKF